LQFVKNMTRLRAMHSDWPLIRYRDTTPNHPWMIDCGLINGKRIRYSARTKTEAEEKAAALRLQRRQEGENSLAPVRLEEDARVALDILRPHGATLAAAARFYVANLEVIAQVRTVSVVIAELIKSKIQDGVSARYRQDLGTRLTNVFARDFGTRPVHEVTLSELEDWLRARDDWSPINRNNYARVIGLLFRFALARGYILKDPCARLSRAKVQQLKPGILSLDEARGLLSAAGPYMRAPIALLLFAGLRPEAELLRLDWTAIDLGERLIDITASKNSASHRFIKVSDNLAAFLENAPRRDSRVVCFRAKYFSAKMKKVRERAAGNLRRAGIPCPSLEEWPNHCLRHTFASMHYGAFKNAHETAEQMGHAGSLRMFFRHYRNRVKETEALAFWQLIPPSL
jgi:integrase